MELKYRDKGLNKLIDRIKKKTDSVSAKDRKFINVVWTYVFADIQKHFRDESGPDGKWNPLSEITLRNRRGSSAKILQDTGNMRQSFKPDPYKTKGEKLIFFNFANYSKIHDKGGETSFKGRKVSIPQRKFMWLSKEAMDNMAKDIPKFILGD